MKRETQRKILGVVLRIGATIGVAVLWFLLLVVCAGSCGWIIRVFRYASGL